MNVDQNASLCSQNDFDDVCGNYTELGASQFEAKHAFKVT